MGQEPHAELVRANLLPPDAVAASPDAFLFGADANLVGLDGDGAGPSPKLRAWIRSSI
jgi:hypothetical protein